MMELLSVVGPGLLRRAASLARSAGRWTAQSGCPHSSLPVYVGWVDLRCCRRLHSGLPAGSEQQPARRVSRRREQQQEADRLLLAAVSAGQPPSDDDWERVTARYRQLVPAATVDAVDYQVLRACRETAGGGGLAAARSLLRHRRSQHAVPAANLAMFLELLANCDPAARSAADADTLAAHAALASAPLDRTSAARAVLGLSATRHWRLALQLLPAARQDGAPPRAALSALAAAALRDGDDPLGWQALDELAEHRLRPDDDAIDAWIDRCEARGHAEARAFLRGVEGEDRAAEVAQVDVTAAEMVERLLEYLSVSGVIISEQQALRLRDFCTKRLAEPWIGEATQVSNRGRCEHCRLVLPPAWLSAADFAEVQHALEERVLIGDDVFQTSTPEEVERFKSFVQRTAPYDVVVDGLNVSFSFTSSKGTPLSRALVQVVDHFAVQGRKKVLVIGRYHMKGWKKSDMSFVKRHALLFTADNMSADDTFLLYAVMHSHPRTQFVTRDYFRDHAARLPEQTRCKFNQLVRSNRLAVQGVTRNGNLNIKMPIVHSVKAQRDPGGGWHVPFSDRPPVGTSTTTPSPTQPVTDRWLCLRPSAR